MKKGDLMDIGNTISLMGIYSLWEWYNNNGKLFYKGNYINGNQVGLWERYYDNGQLETKKYYI